MQILNNPPNQMFEDYVYHSLLYYGMDEQELQDTTYDALCKRLLDVWDQVTHPDKHLSDVSALAAGTGFQMLNRWPQWVIDRAKARGYEHWVLNQTQERTSPPVILEQEQALVLRPTFTLPFKNWEEAYCGIGSRETPDDVQRLMEDVGEFQCNRGVVLTSGGAPGADDAFHRGAKRSPKYCSKSVEIYLPWNGFKREGMETLYHAPDKGIYNASLFDNWELAEEISLKARGSWNGLGQGGIKLQVRNAYQPLRRDLNSPVKGVIFWAIPAGKRRWKGGTNTALQIALEHAIPMYNLYVEEERKHIESFIRNNKTA